MTMIKDENYRPANIEFDVAYDGSNMPETFGKLFAGFEGGDPNNDLCNKCKNDK